jgi:hypothetical protein
VTGDGLLRGFGVFFIGEFKKFVWHNGQEKKNSSSAEIQAEKRGF